MRLNLALHGILVASAPIDSSKCKDEFYLQAVRQQMLRQNEDIIGEIAAKPFFYIEVPASSASLPLRKAESKATGSVVNKTGCRNCQKDCVKAIAAFFSADGIRE
jgi:hypothetical protein